MQNSKFDLEERTELFSTKVIEFCKKLPISTINKPIIDQLIRSATSIGANYCEANGADSKADFKNKISICKKEAKETKYWLKMICVCNPELKEQIKELFREAEELSLIFAKIALSCKIIH